MTTQPTYTITWYPEPDNCWVAIRSDYPTLNAFGDTPQDALRELGVVLQLAEESKGKTFVTVSKKEFNFRAYISGDYECFCFAVPDQDCRANQWKWDEYQLNRFHKGLVSIYPDDLLPETHESQLYRLKITVEAEPIGASELPPLTLKVKRAINRITEGRRYSYFDEDANREQKPE